MASGGTDRALRAQMSVRENAVMMREYLSDLGKWEKEMRTKEAAQRRTAPRARPRSSGSAAAPAPVRVSGGVVAVQSSGAPPAPAPPPAGKASSAARHTHDAGYRRWDSFDVDGALQALDAEAEAEAEAAAPPGAEAPAPGDAAALTPATLASHAVRQNPRRAVPAPRPAAERSLLAEEERARGNACYREGDFSGAVKCYTRSIGLDPGSPLGFSNRAQAFLKMKEYRRAEGDATLALRADPAHGKSYLRRAAARTGLGKLRAALLDIQTCRERANVPPKALQVEERSAREALRAAARRAPRARVPVACAEGPRVAGGGVREEERAKGRGGGEEEGAKDRRSQRNEEREGAEGARDPRAERAEGGPRDPRAERTEGARDLRAERAEGARDPTENWNGPAEEPGAQPNDRPQDPSAPPNDRPQDPSTQPNDRPQDPMEVPIQGPRGNPAPRAAEPSGSAEDTPPGQGNAAEDTPPGQGSAAEDTPAADARRPSAAPPAPIRSGYDLETSWVRATRGLDLALLYDRCSAPCALVTGLKASSVGRLLRGPMDAGVVFGLLAALPGAFFGASAAKRRKGLSFAEKIVTAKAFAMADMLATERDRGRAAAFLGAMEEALRGAGGEREDLEAKAKVVRAALRAGGV